MSVEFLLITHNSKLITHYSLLLPLCTKRPITELAGGELPLHRVLTFDSAAVPQLDPRALHICRYDELYDLPLDRARQFGFSHQLRRVVSCQLLAVLFECDCRCTSTRGGLHTERPDAAHIRSRCLAPDNGTQNEHGHDSCCQPYRFLSHHSAPI